MNSDATNDLRDRAWNAIQDFRAKNGLRSRNRVDQDIKPSKLLLSANALDCLSSL